MDNIFLPPPKKRQKNKAAARLATLMATRYTGNRFFLGWPNFPLSDFSQNSK